MSLKISPLTYLETIKPKTIEDVLKSKIGGLSKIIRIHGEAVAKSMLVLLMDDLVDFFSFNRSMGTKQITQTVDLIMDTYPTYTPEDFIICFNNIKLSKYGKLYEGIDGAKILDMLHQYDMWRDEQLTEFHQKKNKDHSLGTMPDFLVETIKPILKKMEETKKTEINLEFIVPVFRERTEEEIIVQEIFNEFDRLHLKKEHNNDSIRTITYKGIIATPEKFIELRLEELKLL